MKNNDTIKKLLEKFQFGKGTIRSKKDAEDYINFGYKPSRLLLHYDIVDNKALQYVLAKIAKEETMLN